MLRERDNCKVLGKVVEMVKDWDLVMGKDMEMVPDKVPGMDMEEDMEEDMEYMEEVLDMGTASLEVEDSIQA